MTSQYFSNKNDNSVVTTDRTVTVLNAMKKEWWYDMFDVDRSQFDVSLTS